MNQALTRNFAVGKSIQFSQLSNPPLSKTRQICCLARFFFFPPKVLASHDEGHTFILPDMQWHVWTEVQGSMPQNNVCTFQPQQMSTQFKQRWGWIPGDTQMSSLHLQQHQPKMCPVPLSGVTSTHTILHFTNLECRAHWLFKRRLLNQECFQILLLTTF